MCAENPSRNLPLKEENHGRDCETFLVRRVVQTARSWGARLFWSSNTPWLPETNKKYPKTKVHCTDRRNRVPLIHGFWKTQVIKEKSRMFGGLANVVESRTTTLYHQLYSDCCWVLLAWTRSEFGRCRCTQCFSFGGHSGPCSSCLRLVVFYLSTICGSHLWLVSIKNFTLASTDAVTFIKGQRNAFPPVHSRCDDTLILVTISFNFDQYSLSMWFIVLYTAAKMFRLRCGFHLLSFSRDTHTTHLFQK